MFYISGSNSLNVYFLRKKLFLYFRKHFNIYRVIKTNFFIFLVSKDKNSCFFPGEPHKVFHFSVFMCFIFFTFLECFYFSPFLGVLVLFYHKCYGFEKVFLLSGVFFTLHSSTFDAVLRVRRIWESCYYSDVFNLTLLPTFGTTCFYQGFPRSQEFFFGGCLAFHWGLKRKPGTSVCLNHIVFSKRY